MDDKEKYIKEINKLKEDLQCQQYNIDYLVNEYNKIINSRSWKLFNQFQNLKDKINDINLKLTLKNDYKQSILFFVHSWINIYDQNLTNIGGTTNHVLDLINSIKDKKNCYVLSIINSHYVLISFIDGKQDIYDLQIKAKSKYFDEYNFDFYYLVKMIIKELKIDLLHIHHVAGFPCDLHFLAKEFPTIITLHDYFLLCPNYFMICSYNSKLCINSNKQDCAKCVGLDKNKYKVRNNACSLLLKYVKKVIVPDESVLNEFKTIFTLPESIVIPHGIEIDKFNFSLFLRHKFDPKNINIAFVGYLQQHKGSNIITDLINDNQYNITYHLFGTSDNNDLMKNKDNYIYHGVYNRYDLPKMLNENDIDLVLMISTCPETYNYTLSEVLLAKIPVLCFNLGAIANRVKKYGIGWVIEKSHDFNYQDIIFQYKYIFNKMEYQKVLKKCENAHVDLLENMIFKTNKIYDETVSVNKFKNNYEIRKFLKKIYKKYTL